MADKKISQLTAATTPLAGTEVLPIVQSSTTVKVSVADVTKGRTIQTTGINDNNNNEVITITTTASAVNEITVANAATGANPVISATGGDTNIGITLTPKGTGNAVLTSGNLVVASGAGIDFSADPHAPGMTSELLDDYEEGTWTPIDSSGAGLSLTVANATYVKIGRQVFANFAIVYPATANPATARVGGLPFTSSSVGFSHPMAVSTCQTGICKTGLVDTGATTFLLIDTTANALTVAQMSGLFLRGTVIYEV